MKEPLRPNPPASMYFTVRNFWGNKISRMKRMANFWHFKAVISFVFAIFKVFLFLLNGVRGEETKKTSSCPAAFIHTYLLKTMKNLSVKTILILFFLSFRYSSVSNRLNNKVSERCVCELLLLEVNRNLFLFAFSSNSDTFIKNSRSRLVYFFAGCRFQNLVISFSICMYV